MSKPSSTQSKDNDLVEITETEFLKYIARTLDTCEDKIAEYESTMKTFQRLYRDYSLDKDHNRLKFYLQGTTLMYDVQRGSGKVGYKFNTGDTNDKPKHEP